jgi:hypothetical protein
MLNQILKHKDVWGVEVLLQPLLSLTLDRGDRSATRIDRLTTAGTKPPPAPLRSSERLGSPYGRAGGRGEK